jgi:PTS system nitrogen regulatory IIA component
MMVKLNEVLSAERVTVGVSVTSKKKALEELANLLVRDTAGVTAAEAFASLTAREKLGSTGLGHGVAIPHGRVSGIEDSVGAFMRLKHPVDYDAHDGAPVDLVFGLLVPQSATDSHLKHLAAIAELFSDREFCATLRHTADDKKLYALIAAYTAPGGR